MALDKRGFSSELKKEKERKELSKRAGPKNSADYVPSVHLHGKRFVKSI